MTPRASLHAMNPEKILVGVDFSAPSELAQRFGLHAEREDTNPCWAVWPPPSSGARPVPC